MPGLSSGSFHGQFGEDRFLAGRLEHVEHGRYVDVGANHPTVESVSYFFYENGWDGITVEPVAAYAQLHREQRPRDRLIEACISPHPEVTLYVIEGTGLSTVNPDYADRCRFRWTPQPTVLPGRRLDDVMAEVWEPGTPIHFMSIDVEGAEHDVLSTFDLAVWRPWYLVIEATEPNTTVPSYAGWEPIVLDAGYRLIGAEGVNRFYGLEDEHA